MRDAGTLLHQIEEELIGEVEREGARRDILIERVDVGADGDDGDLGAGAAGGRDDSERDRERQKDLWEGSTDHTVHHSAFTSLDCRPPRGIVLPPQTPEGKGFGQIRSRC